MTPYLIFVLLLILISTLVFAELSMENCLLYGFNSQVVQCKTCDHIADILGDASEAFANCRKCCVNEQEKTETKYKKVVLEVDKRSLPFSPDLEAIVKMKKDLKIQVRNRYGSARLLMFTESTNEEPSDILAVQGWTKDTFLDYFKTYFNKNSD